MRFGLDEKVVRLGRRMPTGLLRVLLRACLGRRHLALMFHRVRHTRPGDLNAANSITEQDLDAILMFLLGTRSGRTERWLTLTFDDGYDDAVAYVEARARRFDGVDFILFPNPEKTERAVGFRWDLAEAYRQNGEPIARLAEVFEAPQDIETENARDDLRRVATDPQFRLASLERVRAVAQLPNVSLGNHTNCHFELARLHPDQARLELERSQASFERLFGQQRHFAFPFGHGFFDDGHVDVLRSLGDSILWGTGQSPFLPGERAPGAVLPRIGINGPWSLREAGAVVAGRSLVTRLLGVRSVRKRGRRRARWLPAR